MTSRRLKSERGTFAPPPPIDAPPPLATCLPQLVGFRSSASSASQHSTLPIKARFIASPGKEQISLNCLFSGSAMTKSRPRVSAILLSRCRLFKGRPFSCPGFGVFIGLVVGDDDAAFEDEMDAVADNIHAGVIFKAPAPAVIYHSLTFDVNPILFPSGIPLRFILEGGGVWLPILPVDFLCPFG